ncbi:interleukin-23 receptor [Pyxicephalus adspersus]|uniref:interleukin-23 receptor n=1 Tax=Pyxicephalus adspersus TaxID=30357 RepID=UPI003B5A4477
MPHSDMGALPSTWTVICMVYLVTMKASDGFYTKKGEIIFNPSSVVPKGSNISVICTMTTDPCSGRGRFVFGIDDHYTKPHWMNATVSVLLLPNVRNHQNIVCYLECTLKHILRMAKLKVGYPPDPPSNISCSLGELSSEMTCVWNTGQETELDTYYDIRVNNLQTGESYIEEKRGNSVQIPVNRTQDKTFHIQITARNQLNSSVSDVMLIRLSDIVIPITPVISDIQLLQSTFKISISWRNLTWERRSYCDVQYKTLKDPSWKAIGQEVYINNSFAINKTQTADFLRVRCKEQIGNSYWSNWSAPHQVPPSAPEGTPNVWRILGPEYPNGTQEVTILIKTDHDEFPHRTISGYKVFHLDNKNMKTLRTCGSKEVQCVTLVPKRVKMIFVSAYNAYGTSPESYVPIQEESDLPPPLNLTATPGPMQLHWQSPHSTGQPFLWYVLQWNPDTCDGKPRNVSWLKLLKDRTHFSFNGTMSGEEHVSILLYAVYSSGVSRPSMVEFEPLSGPDSITAGKVSLNALLIQWSEVPTCKRRGFITTYTLYVTEQSSGVLYKFNSDTRHFIFNEYKRDQSYLVCISASTKAGEGPSDSCAFIEPENSLQNYFGPLLGACFGGITLTTLILALSVIRKRIKAALKFWLPKYLCEEYPNVKNSVVVKSLQEKPEDSGLLLNPSYSDPEITDVQEAIQPKYAPVNRGAPEARQLFMTTTEYRLEHVAEADPLMTTTDNDLVETMVEVGPSLQTTTDDIEHMSGYRPQITQSNLQSQDPYCSPSQLLDIHRESLRLEVPIDRPDRNNAFHMDFSLFQRMNLLVENDRLLEDGAASLQGQKCSEITEMADILGGQPICNLQLDRGEIQDTNPYFPQMFARGP